MHCRHRPTCPGCPLAELPYAQQLKRKRERLVRALAPFGHLPEPAPIVGSAWTEGYRHRLKLPLRLGRKVHIGLYGAKREVLHTPGCPVLAEGLRSAIPGILGWLRTRRGVHSLDLRVSEATGELQAIFACRGGELDGGPRAARELIRAVPGLASVAVSRADPQGRKVMGSKPRVIAGKAALEEAIGATRYDLLPGAFFQADPRQAAVLHGLVREGVGDARSVLDLYAGVGAYGLMLAPSVERVVAVEEVSQAAEAARRRAPKNLTVHTGKVEAVRLEGRFDAAVLNPARKGADPGVLERMAQLARRLVYVSCGPETLARDLDVLSAHGMRVQKLVPIDLFPQTAEVETVAVLERGPARRRWAEGRVQGPWHGKASGAAARADEAVALVLGNAPTGQVGPGRVTILGRVATHSLVHIQLSGSLAAVLQQLARQGHPVAGRDGKTARFFSDKAGLVRPFVHVLRAGTTVAPLHGDLVLALRALGCTDRLLQRASRVRAEGSQRTDREGKAVRGRGGRGRAGRGRGGRGRGEGRGGRGGGGRGGRGGGGSGGRGGGGSGGRGGGRGRGR